MRRHFKSHWWVTFFIFIFPLVVIYAYVDFIRSSELNARLGWLLMIGGLAYLFRHTMSQKILLGILALMALSGAFDILYAVTFGGIFTSASFEAMVLTDPRESLEFIIAYASVENVLLLMFYLAVVYWSLRNVDFKPAGTKRQRVYAFLGVLMALVAAQQINQRGRVFDTVPGFVGVAVDYSRGRQGMDEVIKARQTLCATKAFDAVMQSQKPQTYVVVIGESMNRNHLGIYGYARQTTPELSAMSDGLFVFDNVVSAYAQTRPSLSVALTEANLQNKLSDQEAISLLGAAKKAGFKTWWLSNQQPLRMPTTPIAALADQQHFISHDFKGVENHRYDGFLLPYVQQALDDPAEHKVIFVHLMGSHLQYGNRYPEEFDVFEGKDGIKGYTSDLSGSQLDYINEYDNSVRYTDHVLGEILRMLSGRTQIAALSFFADHGEEVFDSKDFKGHGPDGVTHNMLEIPFLFWRNAAYQQQFGQTDELLMKRLHTPFMLDDFFHFGLCFMQVKSDLSPSEMSLCGQEYQPAPRVIYGKDYDKGLQ
ncbi:phosphoethanolamine transferase [Thiomicrorhabdus sp.]|uniref:phosphoethanolamine transferase n=1 Tax=Thiomicrorhabdus sp. TaxID=2039724 RepID=UPI0035661C9E